MKPFSAPTIVALLASILNIDAYVVQSSLADQQSCLKQYETCVEKLALKHVQPCRSELDSGNQVVQHSANGPPKSSLHVKLSPNPPAHITSNGFDEICGENDDGVYPHPASCTKFIQCSRGLAYEFDCPNGLYFNPETKVCDKPENVDCSDTEPPDVPSISVQVEISPNRPAQTMGAFDNLCKDGDGLFSHPKTCTKFIQCSGGIAYEFACPGRLYYNPETLACDSRYNVDCQEPEQAATAGEDSRELKREV